MYTTQYSYIISKKGILNNNMLSRKDSTQKYIIIKEQILKEI